MLRWRIILGVIIVAAVLGICWLDHLAAVPGAWLFPLAILAVVLAGQEVIDLASAGGMRPLTWTVHAGNLLLLLSTWLPTALPQLWTNSFDGTSFSPLTWTWFALGCAVLLVFAGEMGRYNKPGGVTSNLAVAMLAIVYAGVMFCFVVQLRMTWGIGALASLVIVVKLGDIGAYTVGRLAGRHKMAPTLSPKKTIEGALGALAFAALGSWATFTWLVPWLLPTSQPTPWWGWALFAVAVGIAGMFGDLAESLVKRDVGRKDSSAWMPGFGGVLDILDSLLLAAPVAWIFWTLRLVG